MSLNLPLAARKLSIRISQKKLEALDELIERHIDRVIVAERSIPLRERLLSMGAFEEDFKGFDLEALEAMIEWRRNSGPARRGDCSRVGYEESLNPSAPPSTR